MAKPVRVDPASLGGAAGEQARRLYAVPDAEKKPSAKATKKRRRTAEQIRIDRARATAAEARATRAASAPERERAAQSRRDAATKAKNVARARATRNRTIRGVGRRTIRFGKGVHRAAGSPGGAIAGAIGLFIGGGILIAIVRTPAIITTPLRFIGNIMRAFTGLMNAPAAKTPAQNIGGSAPKG